MEARRPQWTVLPSEDVADVDDPIVVACSLLARCPTCHGSMEQLVQVCASFLSGFDHGLSKTKYQKQNHVVVTQPTL